MEKKRCKKNQQQCQQAGMTLVALVVTIIVLLILAGVTLNLALSNNGVIEKATYASNSMANATKKETIQMEEAIRLIDETTINLPSEYQRVEYIESTGTQFIDTKIIPTIDTAMSVGATMTDNDPSSINWCGSVLGGYKGWFALGSYGNNCLVAYISNDQRKGATIPFDTQYHEYYISNGLQCIDNISNNNYILDFKEKMLSIYLFKGHNNFGTITSTKQRIFYAKIFEEEKLEHYYIPCYSTTAVTDINNKQCQEGTIGLYDTVEREFYTNQGTGEFIKGPNV